MMWMIILILTIAASLAGIIYLAGKVQMFLTKIKRISQMKKLYQKIIALAGVLLGVLVITLIFDFINALICVLHLLIISLICDLVGWIARIKNKKAVFLTSIGLTVVYLAVGFYLAHHVWVTSYDITMSAKTEVTSTTIDTEKTDTEKQTDTTNTIETGTETQSTQTSLKVVMFADSHIGTTFHKEEFAEYVEQMNAEKPDVVFIVGDFVDDDTTKDDMLGCTAALANLHATYGIYYVYGNHDKGYYDNAIRGYTGDDLANELEKNGVTVLTDDVVRIADRFYIVGRNDLSEIERGGSRADISELMKEVPEDGYSIVLDHQPSDYDAEAAAGADLVLSGHTHGGQLIPITYVGEWIGANDNTYGYEQRDNTDFIVTSGISDWAIKFKTGCKSEYVVINIDTK